MNSASRLYQVFDPSRPLTTSEADQRLYVDWQDRLGLDDVKRLLATGIALSGTIPVTRLLTGHRGSGKTTELRRVQRLLEEGVAGHKMFVSYGFFNEIQRLFKSEVALEEARLTAGPLRVSADIKQIPGARPAFRRLIEPRLPLIHQLINQEILKPAEAWLRKHRDCTGVLMIVDELDRIPRKTVTDGEVTNHEHFPSSSPIAIAAGVCKQATDSKCSVSLGFQW